MDAEGKPFENLMNEKTQLLIDSFEQGNAAVKDLIDLNNSRHDAIYQHVGRIARGLHSAIANMELVAAETGSEDQEVQTRLGYVINLTQDAANKTMDLAEESTPIAAELGSASKSLRLDWGKLISRELTASEFRDLYQRIDDFLAYSEEQSNQLHTNLTDIVVTQGYQDLSGQVLQKIVSMLNDTESELVNLLEVASQMNESVPLSDLEQTEPEQHVKADAQDKDLTAEGPLMHNATTLKNQDEVDDLLSNLGF